MPDTELPPPHDDTDDARTITLLSSGPDAGPLAVDLVVLDGKGHDRVFSIDDGADLVVGRAEEATVRIDDASISRKHAVVGRRGADLFVRDLGSRNGTRVRAEVLRNGEWPVAPGDAIVIGTSRLFIAARLARPPIAPPPDAPDARHDAEEESVAGVVVADPAMQKCFLVARRLAKTQTTVLLLGETGVGKEILAEEVHRHSPRTSGPLVRLNCASLPESLLESELFGHERGAFTGAVHRKTGYVEAADGGTLFLDEIGELPLATQVKLLRVLETRRFARVGSTVETEVDVRVVCATHRDLESDIAAGRFRLDLYYRISAFTIRVPPLRDRPAEIPMLAALFARRFAERMGTRSPAIEPDAAALLSAHPWPGNVRELRNAIEYATVVADGAPITRDALPEAIRDGAANASHGEDAAGLHVDVADLERRRILTALDAEGGNQTRAARRLGITRSALLHRFAKYGIGKK